MGIQVSQLTQGKEPWEKEFIDFSFNGKYISEFNLVATSSGDRYSFSSFPSFEDEVSDVQGAFGQLYWGTRVQNLRRSFNLATDGMTEQDLSAFKEHFRPGQYGRFIEPHLPYRYSNCRVAEVVQFDFVPFKKEITYLGQKITTNEYKGTARIVFVWDNPKTYSEYNCVPEDTGILNQKEQARLAYTNNVPKVNSWKGIKFEDNLEYAKAAITDCYIGNYDKLFYDSDQKQSSLIPIDNGFSGDVEIAYFNPSTIDTDTIVFIKYFPIFTPITNNNQPIFFANIADNINSSKEPRYDEIQISKQIEINNDIGTKIPSSQDYVTCFKFSTPSVLYFTHRAIQIAWDIYKNNSSITYTEIENALQLEIHHKQVLKWAITVLKYLTDYTIFVENGIFYKERYVSNISLEDFGSNLIINAHWAMYFNLLMLYGFSSINANTNVQEDGILKYLSLEDNNWKGFQPFLLYFYSDLERNKIFYYYFSINDNKITQNFVSEGENCGDMLYSGYLQLEGGDTLTPSGDIKTCHLLRLKRNGELVRTQDAYITLQYPYCYI